MVMMVMIVTMRMMAENVDCRVECDYGNGDGVDTKGDGNNDCDLVMIMIMKVVML